MPDDKSKRIVRQFRDLDEKDFKSGAGFYDRSVNKPTASTIKRDLNGFPEGSIFYQPSLVVPVASEDITSQATSTGGQEQRHQQFRFGIDQVQTSQLSTSSTSLNNIFLASSVYFDAPSDLGRTQDGE